MSLGLLKYVYASIMAKFTNASRPSATSFHNNFMFCRNWSIAFLLVLLAPLTADAQPSSNLEQQVLEIIKRHPQVVLDSIRAYQAESARTQRRAEWQKYLSQPVKVNIQNAPILGAVDAPLTLVEFADFQCPFCMRVQPTIKALLEKYKGKIRLVYMHLPLPTHSNAKAAAMAAWAAGQQGKFFEYHDQLFALKGKIKPENYEQIAQALKLNSAKFNRDRQSPQSLAQVEANQQQAENLQINGTPIFVLNGIVMRGVFPLEDFEEVIKLAQQK